jgi:hypothetical protein
MPPVKPALYFGEQAVFPPIRKSLSVILDRHTPILGMIENVPTRLCALHKTVVAQRDNKKKKRFIIKSILL